MKIERLEINPADVLPGAIGLDRSSGRPHVTGLIRAINRASGQKAKGGSGWNSTMEETVEAGFIWEDVLSSVFRDRLNVGVRPGEVSRDGIVGSPDSLIFTSREMILGEVKCTWRSSKRLLEENQDWIWQTQAYCAMLRILKVRFFVLYLNGGYREDFGPCFRVFNIEYTQQEVEETWAMLVNHKYLLEEA